MMDDSIPSHKRRKLVKTYKNVLPISPPKAAEVCRETYFQIDYIKME